MRVNKLFDYADFDDVDLVEIRKEINETNSYERKSWEFTIMSYGLYKYCPVDSIALGLGCLKESLIYLYANKFKHTYATDVAYYIETEPCVPWGGERYTIDEMYESNIPYDRDKLTVLYMDMTKLAFPDDMFDVVWSSSSVEHVGGLKEVFTCFEEVQRVLKPGGIFSITTEWNLNYPDSSCVKFANVQTFDPYVLDTLGKIAPRLKLLEPVSLERSGNPRNTEKQYMLGKTNRFYGNAIDYTSMSLFWRKE